MRTNQARKLAKTQLEKTLSNTKKSFFYVGVFSMFINILALTPSIYMLQVYDRVMSSRSIDTLILITGIVAIMFVTTGILDLVRSRILVRIGNQMDLELNSHLFDVVFTLARLNPSGATTQPITDLTKIRQFMTGNGVFAFFDSPWFPIYILIMYIFSPWFALYAVFAAIVLVSITFLNEKTTKKMLAEANGASSQALNYVNKNLLNAEIVHAMGMNDDIRDRWLQKHLKFLSVQSKASDLAGRWTNMSKTLRQFFQALTYGLGAYLAINGLISSGMIIAGAVLLGRALAPLDLLTNAWKGFSDARESYNRLNNLLTHFPEMPETMDLPAPKGEIRVENIIVTPPGSQIPALKGINMLIPVGTTLGIIGPSASGKSTFARAILGVWPIANGKVRLDGADVHQWDSVKLGKYIGYLPQDIELFEGSVSENISRFSELNAEDVVEAAKIAGVHEMILKLPQGYDTIVGAGGTTLSGGQRQRVGLARAVYQKPPVIVLDEPNSNLDDEGEKALVGTILQMKENGSTIVLITHRPSILNVVDNIAVFSGGTLSMHGEKEEIFASLKQKALQNHLQPSVQDNSKVVPKMTKPGE